MELRFDYKKTKVQQLSDYIKNKIIEKELKLGDKLPSINTLSKNHKVSRDTVYKAFMNLKEKGVIDSIHGKSYYVINDTINVILLLDEYSQFKEAFYQSLVDHLPSNVKVDLLFHQYNERLFDTLINDAVGRYNKYLIMNYSIDKLSDTLKKIDKSKLLLLDFGDFNKDDYSYICQDFGFNFYDALNSIKSEISKYNKLVLIINKKHKHPRVANIWFKKFCEENHFEYELNDGIIDETTISKNNFYIVVKLSDIVKLIKKSREMSLKMGVDYGLIAYNDMPYYDVIDRGISSMTTDWYKMGELASGFILNNTPIQIYLPTTVIRRNSF